LDGSFVETLPYDLNPVQGKKSSLGISSPLSDVQSLGQPPREGENNHELIQIENKYR
jgi:hypothetical protein